MRTKIGERGQRSGVSTDTLRHYERIGLLPRIPRDGRGRRDCDAAALAWLAFLGRLKTTGKPLADLRRDAVLRAAGPFTENERRAAPRPVLGGQKGGSASRGVGPTLRAF
ncbi:MAG: MerR family DNA-binding transcriptional regulator [Tabrizicola sp.]|nr:MerR family DNA-binding transcriptional regulator [Tabrizicola sp.]